MKLSRRRFGLGIWVLIFAGMGLASLGYAGYQQGAPFGGPAMVIGAAAVVAGIVGIWLRSRMPDRPDT